MSIPSSTSNTPGIPMRDPLQDKIRVPVPSYADAIAKGITPRPPVPPLVMSGDEYERRAMTFLSNTDDTKEVGGWIGTMIDFAHLGRAIDILKRRCFYVKKPDQKRLDNNQIAIEQLRVGVEAAMRRACVASPGAPDVQNAGAIGIGHMGVDPGIIHAIFGIASEAGELIELLLKAFINNGQVDFTELLGESGDIEWYHGLLRVVCRRVNAANAGKWHIEVIWDGNLAKLTTRLATHGHDATQAHSTGRNLEAESKALEGGTHGFLIPGAISIPRGTVDGAELIIPWGESKVLPWYQPTSVYITTRNIPGTMLFTRQYPSDGTEVIKAGARLRVNAIFEDAIMLEAEADSVINLPPGAIALYQFDAKRWADISQFLKLEGGGNEAPAPARIIDPAVAREFNRRLFEMNRLLVEHPLLDKRSSYESWHTLDPNSDEYVRIQNMGIMWVNLIHELLAECNYDIDAMGKVFKYDEVIFTIYPWWKSDLANASYDGNFRTFMDMADMDYRMRTKAGAPQS